MRLGMPTLADVVIYSLLVCVLGTESNGYVKGLNVLESEVLRGACPENLVDEAAKFQCSAFGRTRGPTGSTDPPRESSELFNPSVLGRSEKYHPSSGGLTTWNAGYDDHRKEDTDESESRGFWLYRASWTRSAGGVIFLGTTDGSLQALAPQTSEAGGLYLKHLCDWSPPSISGTEVAIQSGEIHLEPQTELPDFSDVLAFDGSAVCTGRYAGILRPHVICWAKPVFRELRCTSWDGRLGAQFTPTHLFIYDELAARVTSFPVANLQTGSGLLSAEQTWDLHRMSTFSCGVFALNSISSTAAALLVRDDEGLVIFMLEPQLESYPVALPWCKYNIPTNQKVVSVAFPSSLIIFWVQTKFNDLPVSCTSELFMAHLPPLSQSSESDTSHETLRVSCVCQDDIGLLALSTSLHVDNLSRNVYVYERGASSLTLISCGVSSDPSTTSPTLGITRWWQNWEDEAAEHVLQNVQQNLLQDIHRTDKTLASSDMDSSEELPSLWTDDFDFLMEDFLYFPRGPEHVARHGFGLSGTFTLCAIFEDPETPSYALKFQHLSGLGYCRLDDLCSVPGPREWFLSSYTSFVDCVRLQQALQETRIGHAQDLLKIDHARVHDRQDILEGTKSLQDRLACAAQLGVLPTSYGNSSERPSGKAVLANRV
ncbi:hypothetical protein DACRYDRAFT_18157 [Dacryopinax primogenitus]|uniref:Uncharacterized protein n=1 Tax=Dacryopinax primogenitus (strain DJM 731) TaxID=1858805 RepID=M5FS94_DACPD|nr:uncharacterized protein DACRYDRAFT_18157 [Dacryopinax primogenitus]EJT98034.1 hypothetical protein DACRYDRAFT_18157 [Dacryopinax primogenitus]